MNTIEQFSTLEEKKSGYGELWNKNSLRDDEFLVCFVSVFLKICFAYKPSYLRTSSRLILYNSYMQKIMIHDH